MYLTALVLVTIRIFCLLMVVPEIFPAATSGTIKVGFTIVIAYILLPGIDYSTASSVNNIIPFAFNCLNEATAGLFLGFIINLCFMCFRMAGSFMDLQVGFSMVSLYDPNTSSSNTFLERTIYWFSIMIFFIIDGHHMVLKALMESFNIIKVGNLVVNSDSINIIIMAFIKYFALGLRIAIPIMLVILITDLTLGLISRTVPQLNIMIFGLPVKILVGLLTFSLMLSIFMNMIISSFESLPSIIQGFYKTLPVLIIFAADDKTEEATPKKKSDARKKGQVPRSKEVGLALTLLATTLVLAIFGGYAVNGLGANIAEIFNNYLNMSLTYDSVQKVLLISVWRIALIFLPIVLPIMAMGVISSFIQTGAMFTTEPLKPDFKKLSPIGGFKKMFSVKTVAELFKDIIIISIVGYVGFKFVKDNYLTIIMAGNASVPGVFNELGTLTVSIFFRITIVLITIAIIDYVFQRYQFNKDLRMTKQEIKEEYKQEEGDPQIKSKIRQKQREMAMRRMMQEVPKATVVVTNPTHLAVAIKYEEGQNAPIVVAKGADNLALKIKEKASENKVPIIENKPLARMLYSQVELDQEIPMDMYQAVAEILALVFKIKRK